MSNNDSKNGPSILNLEKGKTYAWCSCAQSDNQPWCDGSHKGSGKTPIIFQADEDKKYAMCTCKQTSNSVFCDGSHSK